LVSIAVCLSPVLGLFKSSLEVRTSFWSEQFTLAFLLLGIRNSLS
jgi:hypothetical protein